MTPNNHVPFAPPTLNKPAQDRLIYHKDRMEKRGLLSLPFPVVLVGGTNGKGSVSHVIHRIFEEAGYRVGLNTSPHLVRFNERIQIHSKALSDEELEHYFEKIQGDFEGFPLGYNEYAFLLALYAFIDQSVDLAVFEIGLGGRLDPANTLNANLSVIASIDYDHTEILGDTLAKIAFEKAGIIKAACPVIVGDLTDEAFSVIASKAQALKAPLSQAGVDFSFKAFQEKYDLPAPSVLPINAALGIQAALAIAKTTLPLVNTASVLQSAMKNLIVPGRMQPIPWKFPLILDVCHNPAGARALAEYLKNRPISGKTYALFAVSETKDASEMIQALSPFIDHWSFAEVSGLKSASVLIEEAKALLPPNSLHSRPGSVSEMLSFWESKLTDADRLMVFGSFYLAGELLCTVL